MQKKINQSMTVPHAETYYIFTDDMIVVAEGSQNAGPPSGCVHKKGRPSVCHSCWVGNIKGGDGGLVGRCPSLFFPHNYHTFTS